MKRMQVEYRMIDCDRALLLLTARDERELERDEQSALDEHLGACATCRQVDGEAHELSWNTRSRDRAGTPEAPGRSQAPIDARTPAGGMHTLTEAGAAPEHDPRGLRPGLTLGQHQLIRELGRGGMGAVYLARDTRLGRRVAIKFMSRAHPTRAARFLAEARVTARLEHDHIVNIHEFGEALGHSYMVLEYLEGVTLRAWLRDRWQHDALEPESEHAEHADTLAPVSATLAVEMMVPVVRALVHAHGHGLVHRDLKPENIMLTDSGAIKVLDFGIAKVLDDAAMAASVSDTASAIWSEHDFRTMPGALVGTGPYMAPEQWRVGDIDARADIWAVGILFWELCTGRHPLAPLDRERLRAVADLDLPMPSLAEARPGLGALADIVDGCLEKRLDERIPSAQALLDALEPLLPGRAARAMPGHGAAEPDNPYVGLAAFQRSDAARFFGRERDIASMLAQLRNHRMVTVAGPSGAGKSSLVRAGVIPALERSGQRWQVFITRPGRRPLAALADILAQATREASPSQDPAATASANPSGVHEARARIESLRTQPGYLGTVLRERCQQRHARALVFVDQFEELYTLGTDRATREAFVHCLEGMADDASSPLRVLLSVRSDFLDRVAEDRAFTSEIIRGMTLLPPLSRDGLRAALLEPLREAGYTMQSQDLVERMLDTLEATRAPLPLLSFTAARLWDARDTAAKRITEASYDALGGIEGALATHADAVLAGLSQAEQRLARAVFTSLVSEERTRAIVSVDELRSSVGADAEALERVVHHLADTRLILMESDQDAGTTVELTHESLIERWVTLKRWLDDDQEAADFRARLRVAARQWQEGERSRDLLWRGQAAATAARWHERLDDALGELGPRDRAFLEAVIAEARRARRRRRRIIGAGFALLSAVALVIALLAVRAEREAAEATRSAAAAERNALHARNATRVAAASERKYDPTLTLALVRELEPADILPRDWRELAHWATRQELAKDVLMHPCDVWDAAFSPDGTRIVTACEDGMARVWRVDGRGEPLLLEGHRGAVHSAAFSPDGERIVTASRDRTARLWRADGAGEPLVLDHRYQVRSAAFSPDGARIVTASEVRGGATLVWRADGTGEPLILDGRGLSAAFSPDGAWIVTTPIVTTPMVNARVWPSDGSGEPRVLAGHTGFVVSAVFSPDGTRIATTSGDRTARIWRTDGTGEPLVLEHERSVVSAMFSPDGTHLITASGDKMARIWRTDGAGEPRILRGHQARLNSAAFSPDGRHIVTASHDKSARLWRVDGIRAPVRLEGHQRTIHTAAFSPDGTRIVTASTDKTARVWPADGRGEPVVLAGHEYVVSTAAFSPDGTRIVTASWDGTVRVWPADGNGAVQILEGHQGSVSTAVFSPDGERIVSASEDKIARVWRADGSGEPLALKHPDMVFGAAFSPDGERIVTGSVDGIARVWRADGVGEPLLLRGHQGPVICVEFSPDGQWIVTGSGDGTVRIWPAGGHGEPRVLEVHTGAACAGTRTGRGAFSPESKRMVTMSSAETVYIWNLDDLAAPAILLPGNNARNTAAFSPDGERIVTTNHRAKDPVTGEMRYWASIWPTVEPFTGPDDPKLWRATAYCPPVDLRMELFGISRAQAEERFASCQSRVAAARASAAP